MFFQRTPAKPPRKKSPAPMRKNEHSPLQVRQTASVDLDKEDYETMSNMPKKNAEEDLYGNLFPGLKFDSSSDAGSCDPVSDPMYSNIGEPAERHSASPSVPFSDYRDSKSSNQNLAKSESSISSRTSSGFSHSRTSTEEADNTYTNVASVMQNSKVTENLSATDCGSLNCDKRRSIPNSSTNCNIPKSCDKSVSSIPASLQSESNIPEKSQNKGIPCEKDNENDIPVHCSQRDSKSSDSGQISRKSSTGSRKSRTESESSDQVDCETPKAPARVKSSRRSDPQVPELPPKSDRGDLSKDLVVDEKRLSNGTSERKQSDGDIRSRTCSKVFHLLFFFYQYYIITHSSLYFDCLYI